MPLVPLLPSAVPGANALVLTVSTAPLFMTQLQPNGTSGLDGGWGPNQALWPDYVQIADAAFKKAQEGYMLDTSKVLEWMLPVRSAWRKDESNVITVEDVISAINSYPGMWVKA